MDSVSFKISSKDASLVRKIARRARAIYLEAKVDRDVTDIEMDLTATHANGCPMDFTRLLAADNFNIIHDVGGIARHIDRRTGELTGFFLPRFHAKAADTRTVSDAAAQVSP